LNVSDVIRGTKACRERDLAVLSAAPIHLPLHTSEGRQIAIKVLDSFHNCPIPEAARLGRTLRAWRPQVLAYFDTSGVSNGGTEAINLIIEKVRRLAHGFKDFDHYRLRIMLAADGRRPYRTRPNHA
jgi:transposase